MPTDQAIDLGKDKPLNAAKRAQRPKSDGWFDRGVFILERFGLPLSMLIVVLVLGVKLINWGGEHVVIPITKRHIAFVDESEADRKQTQNLINELSKHMADLANQQRLTNQILRKNGKGESP